MGNVLTREILKKLKKEDLIEIILKMQTEGGGNEKPASKEGELDKKLKEYYKKNEVQPRERPNYNYKCVTCSEVFYDDINTYRTGINDPRCKKCKSAGI